MGTELLKKAEQGRRVLSADQNCPEDDPMCTEQEVEQINKHTDSVFMGVHMDYGQLVNRVDKLEEKFEGSLKEIFGHFRDIRKSIFTSQWAVAAVICGLIIILFGALFNWLWSQEQMRDNQIMSLSSMIGEASANDKTLVRSVQSIESMVKDEIKENHEVHKEDLGDHLKYFHE